MAKEIRAILNLHLNMVEPCLHGFQINGIFEVGQDMDFFLRLKLDPVKIVQMMCLGDFRQDILLSQ
jgi:hypothetical protein